MGVHRKQVHPSINSTIHIRVIHQTVSPEGRGGEGGTTRIKI